MGTTRFKGENDSERLSFSEISDSDMIQLRHKPGTEEDSDKGISKASLCSCPFGVSDTSASTAVKSAVLTDSNPDFNLVSGREVVVCFTTANTASSPSLNFAGSGSIPIYYPNGSVVGSWPANTWMHLKYFYATIGNTSIQRWILLSPLPVDTVALNNMQSVTSNAVAERIIPLERTKTTAISWSVGTFKGITYKKNNIIYIQGVLTLSSEVIAFKTQLGSIYGTELKPNANLFPALINSRIISLYSSGYSIISRNDIAAEEEIFINAVYPLI